MYRYNRFRAVPSELSEPVLAPRGDSVHSAEECESQKVNTACMSAVSVVGW